MNSYPDFVEKHRELVVLHEHISTLTEQMSTQAYPSLPVYLNNLEHLKTYFEEVSDICRMTGFEQWLREADTDLFISITSQQRSFVLLGNMLANLKRLFLTR
ncbi:hypothetical protein N5E15_13615 [Pantoea stewartii]|uniref:hypothetical protein n=1 Tax=Pantoea stewartii TaxID=66269 RepID=UPI0021D4F9A2|nr:hypothetical protein [Pantoea stewartii]MCU7367630.1 hypothetical protein [Pantoea stewartii]